MWVYATLPEGRNSPRERSDLQKVYLVMSQSLLVLVIAEMKSCDSISPWKYATTTTLSAVDHGRL